MKHAHGGENTSQSCSCTSCISVSTRPSLQRIINQGSKIDKRFDGTFIRSRQKKLIEKLIETRAVYDDVRKQLLSGSINENANLKLEVHTASTKELDDIERSSAVLQLVDLVDKGVLLGPHKLNECCSCCSCSSKTRLHDYRYRGGKYTGYTRNQNLRSKSSVISNRSHRNGTQLKRGLKFKAKHIQSEPCTCTLKLSGLLKHHSELRHKKKYTQSKPTSKPKVVTKDENIKFHKEEYKTLTPEYMNKKAREPIKHTSSKTAIKSRIQSEIKKSREKLQHAKTTIRDRMDSMQREYEKREIIIPSPPEIEEKKLFHIRKDSITKFKERLKRKKELLDYECEPECNPEECAPEECFKKIQLSKILKGKHTGHKKKKSRKSQASSGHSLKRCLCPFKIHTHTEPKVNVTATETPRFLAHETFESRIIDTTMEVEKNSAGVSKPQKNRCFCMLKLHTIGKLAQNDKDYGRITKPTTDITPKVSTKATKTKLQRIDKKNITQCDCFEKLKRNKRSKKHQPQSMTTPTETQTIKHKMHLQSIECEPNICMPGVCDPYECFEKNKKQDRNLQTKLRTPTNHSKMLIATSNATQNLNEAHLNSYECEPYDCIPEKCNRHECLENIKNNKDIHSSSDSGTQRNKSKMISRGSIAKSKIKRNIYTKARKSYYKPASLSSNSNEVTKVLGRTIKISSSFSFSIEFSKSGSNPIENTNILTKDLLQPVNQVPKINKITTMHDKSLAIKRPILKRCLCSLNLQHNKSKRLQTPNIYAVHRLLLSKTINNENTFNVYSLSKLIQLNCSLSEKNKVKDILSCSPEKQEPLHGRRIQHYVMSSNVIDEGDRQNHCKYSAICLSQSNKKKNHFGFHEEIHTQEDTHKSKDKYNISDTTYNNNLSRSDVTGVSRLLKPCFCTMNIQVPINMKKKHGKPECNTLAPFECEQKVCIANECDPNECQKVAMKRNKKQTSTMTGENLTSRANTTPQTVFKDATAGIKSKALKPDKRTLSKKPPFKVSLNRPSPSRHVVRLSSNINFNIQFSKERLLKQPAEETHSKLTDQIIGKQKLEPVKTRRHNLQKFTTKTEDKSADILPKRQFCTLKLHKTPKQMEAIKNIDQFTKAPKRFLKDTYKLPPVDTGQNTKKGWKPEKLYEDKKIQTKNLDIQAKDSSTQVTFYDKGINKQNQTQPQGDEKLVKTHIKPDIPLRQGIRIGSSLSFNIEFYKEKSPDLQAEFPEAEFYKKKSHQLQGVSSKIKRRVSQKAVRGMKSKAKKGVKTKRDMKPKVKGKKTDIAEQPQLKGGKTKSDVQLISKGVKSKSDLKPKSKEGKNINDLQSNLKAKEKNPKIQEQAILSKVDKQPAHHVEPQATETRSLLSKEHKLGNFVENNTLSFKRCFCKKKEKKIPRQIVCMDKPIPESPSKSFLKKCACAFACNEKNCNTHNEILTYHIQEHRFTNLLPYECEPGICVPGECNPYVCDKIIKRRNLKQGTKLSGTERLKTNSTSSYYNPSTKSRSNQSKYYTRHKENKQQSHISRENNSSDRQTVRIGSNINFNFEFYKTGSGLSGEESPTKNYTKTKPKTRSQGSISDISRLNRDAQAVRTQTEHSSVGTELKRCFCTLKYNLTPSSARQGTGTLREENKGMNKGVTVQMRGRGLERYNDTPYEANTRNMTQQTKFPAMNHIPYTLEPHECEPNVCIPGECDPYECLRRINRHMKFRTHGTSPRNNGTKSTSSMAYSMSDSKSKRIQYGPKKRYNTRSIQSKPSRFRQPINLTSSETGRKAVKISSSLHLSIEFTKGGSQEPEKHMSPKFVKPRKIRNENVHTRERKYNDTTLQTNVPRTESKGSGVGPLLKRCFCTLKLQKIGNLQQNVSQLQQNSLSTPMRSVKTNTKKKERFSEPKSRDIAKNIRVGPFLLEQHELGSVPVTETLMKSKQKKTKPTRIPKLNVVESMTVATNTMTRQPRNLVTRPLNLYECEPGICVPGECDPYQCYERIKRREVRSWGVGTDMITRKNASNVYDGDSKSIGIQSLKEKNRYSTPSQTKNRHYENRAGYVRNDEYRDGSRAVRVGSNINFNIEFYKDSGMKMKHVALKKRVRDKEKEYYNRDKPKTRQAGISPVLIPIKNAESQGAELKYENKASGVHNALKRCFCTLKLHDSNLKTRYMNRHSSQSSKLPERQEKTVGAKRKHKIDSKKLKTESKRHSVCDKYPCISSKRDIKITELLNNELATSQRYLFIDDSYNSNALPKFPSQRQKKHPKVIAVNRVAVEQLRSKFYKRASQSSTEITNRRNEKNISNNHLCDTVYYRTCATKEPYCKDSVQKMAYYNKGPDLNGMNTIYPYVPSKFKKHKSKMLLIDNYKQDNLLQGCYRKTCNECSIIKMTKRKRHKKFTATQGSPLIESESKKNKVFGWHFKAFFSRFSTRKQEHMFDITNKIEDYVNNRTVDNKTRQSKYTSTTKQMDGVRPPDSYRRPIENNNISKTNDQNKEIAASHNLSCKCSYKNNFICSYCQIKYQKISSSPYIHNKVAQFSLIPPVHEKEQRNNKNEQLNDRKTTNQHKVLRKYINLSKKNAEVIKSESKTEDITYKCKDGWTSPESVKDDKNMPISKIGKEIKRLLFQRSVNQNDKKSAIVDTQYQGRDNKEQRNITSVIKYLVLLFKSKGKKVKRACGMKNCGSEECQDTASVRLHTQGTFQENLCMEKTDTNPLVHSLSQTKKSLTNKRFFHNKMKATTKNKNNRHGKSATIYTQCNFRDIDQSNTINPLSPLSEYKKDLPDKNLKSIHKNAPTKPAPYCTCRVCQNLNKSFKNKAKSKGKMKISDNDKPIVRQVMADRCRKLSGGDHLSNAICHQTRIQGYQRLKKVYDIPKSKMDDKPCIYKPLFSVGPNLCARCLEGDVINDSPKFDNVGTEPKIKSCIKRTRYNQQFCTCTKKPCVCHVCPKTTKVIELSSGNWLSPVRHLFINDKFETITDKTQMKYARPEDTCEKTRTMLKVEGCGTKLKVIPKNAPTANKTFGVLENFNTKMNVNSANDPISKSPIKNVDDAVVFTRKPQNSSKEKNQNVLEHVKSNLTKKLDETVPFNKEQMQSPEVHKSHHLKNNFFGSPTNEDITGCDKEECPVAHDERHSQQEKGPLSKLLGIKGILDKSNRNKFPRDPNTCYKDICPAGNNYKKAVKKAKQLETKRKKKTNKSSKTR